MAGHVPISKRLVAVNSASAVLAKLLNLSVLVWLNQLILEKQASLVTYLLFERLEFPRTSTLQTSGSELAKFCRSW